LAWKYEADFEARTLMWLIIRNAEGVFELANKDLVLLPAALSVSRSAFEIAIRALWLLEPQNPFEREVRWLAQLTTAENHHERLGRELEKMKLDSAKERENAKSVREFRLAVTALLPKGFEPIKQLPNLEEMMKSLNLRHLYSHYRILSQFAHGTHFAGKFHRKGISIGEGGGEFVRSCDWRYPIEICFFAVTSVGKKLVERMGGDMRPFLTEAFNHKFNVALKRLQNEKVQQGNQHLL
jgi:hypothetical protein